MITASNYLCKSEIRVILFWFAGLLLASDFANGDVGIHPACIFPQNQQDFENSNRVTIDANTGARIRGPKRFPSNTRVQLLFINKNPYRYSYRFEAERSYVEAGIIVDALAIFGIPKVSNPGNVDGNAEPQADELEATTAAGRGVPASCSTADIATINKYIRKSFTISESAGRDRSAANALIKNYTGRLKILDSFVETLGADTDTPQACSSRWTKATQISDDLEEFEGRQQLSLLVKRLSLYGGQLDTNFTELNSKVDKAKCKTELKAVGQDITNRKQLLALKMEPINYSIKSFDAKSKQVKTFRSLIADIGKTPTAFVETLYLPDEGEPTSDAVSIYRKDFSAGAKESRIAGPVIKVGRSRFSISAGLGLSFIDQQSYERQPGLSNDDPPVVESVVGVSESSSSNYSVALQLNGLIYDGSWWGWRSAPTIGWSLGVTAGDGAESNDIGYYTGPSFAMIDGNLLLTFAYQIQTVTELSSGFSVGDSIPDDLQGEIPTTKKSEGGLLLTVTYKIR